MWDSMCGISKVPSGSKIRMSTKYFSGVVSTSVDVGSEGAEGSQAMDERMEMSDFGISVLASLGVGGDDMAMEWCLVVEMTGPD
jgi:hypothetical protein